MSGAFRNHAPMVEILGALVLLVAGLLLLLDLISLGGLAGGVSCGLYHKVCGHIVTATPDDLGVAAANGLLRKGDLVVAAHTHEGEGGTIRRFAVPPSLAGRPAGTVLRVVSITPKRLVLEDLSSKKGSS